MISEFSVKPKPKNNNAKILAIVLLGLSVAVFAVSWFIDSYRGIVGLVAAIFLVSAILIYTKYIAPEYSYDVVIDHRGLPLFVVRQITGKRITTLCRVDLYALRKIEPESGKEARAHKTPIGMRKFIYTPTLFPPSVYRMTVESREENSEIVIEVSDEYAALLWQYATEARSMVTEEEFESPEP